MDIMENQIPSAEPKKSVGPLIGVIIIIIVLLLGAFYIWGGKLSTTRNSADISQSDLAPVSDSDEINDIEVDLTASDSAEIDFSDIEAELQ